jgi:cytochrome c oxidase subunit III
MGELRHLEPPPVRPKPLLPSAVLGTALFVIAEAMLFTGFISAYTIVEANAPPGMWPPPDQPRLPLALTAFTTTLLLASGVLLWHAGRCFRKDEDSARRPMLIALLLGSGFVGIQGVEWARLLAEGLTLTSSSFGGFFYLIVGAHALHAIPALGVLFLQWRKLLGGTLTDEGFAASRLFWYFVVLVWPVVYLKVYL